MSHAACELRLKFQQAGNCSEWYPSCLSSRWVDLDGNTLTLGSYFNKMFILKRPNREGIGEGTTKQGNDNPRVSTWKKSNKMCGLSCSLLAYKQFTYAWRSLLHYQFCAFVVQLTTSK